MPIKITSNELTPSHKKDVRKEFEDILKSLELGKSKKYKHIIGAIEDLGSSNNKLKRSLSNYLMAIYMYLDLDGKNTNPENVISFNYKYENELFATLLYFMNPHDVIPDHIAYIGYLDDAYCVNLALSKQNTSVREKLESIVKALEAIEV